MAREGLGGVLLNGQHNFAWLTGGASNGIDQSRENGAGFVLVRADGKRFSLANNIETPRLFAEEISAEDFEPVEVPWAEEKADPALIVEKAKELAGGEIASDLPLHSSVRAIENLIAQCRYSLVPDEIERYRALGKNTGEALGELRRRIIPGWSEVKIAAAAEYLLAERGIRGVVVLVGADERIANFRHPVPTANEWKKTLLVAVCAKRGGLVASASRIYCKGGVPDELQRKTESTAYVFASLLNATRPGATGAELYRAAAEAYTDQRFADEIKNHHQGGACGYRTREWVAHPASSEIVQENQAFAWNPSISGTKVEETAIVRGDGAEIITATRDWPIITTEIGGKEFHSPGILVL